MERSGFVLVEVSQRGRGRPDTLRRMTVELQGGVRLSFSSSTPAVVIKAVVEAVLRLPETPSC